MFVHMSKKRYVDTKFWDDGFVINLDPIEKLLFLYFLTNPLTELSGAYEISLRRIAFDTGIDREMVLKILDRFSRANKMHYQDGWIWIVNFRNYQALNPKIEAGIARSLNHCPDWIKDRLSKPMDSLSIDYDSLSHSNLDSNLDSNSDLDSNLREVVVADAPTPKPKRVTGTRIPEPFLLTAEMREWANARAPNVDVMFETELFCNHFRAEAGQKGVKRDWLGTWHNWMLRAEKWSGNGSNKGTATKTEYRDKRTVESERIAAGYARVAELRRLADEQDARREQSALLGNGDGTDNQIW